MHIDLTPEVEAQLAEEAQRRGLSTEEWSQRLITAHLSGVRPPLLFADRSQWRIQEPHPPDPEQRQRLFEEHLAWMRRNTPDYETRDPYAVDWQALKAEGRKH